MQNKYIIGIDEAGRGPLAGPVSVGVACVSSDFDWDLIPGVNDSKKLTEKKREEIFKIAQRLKKEGKLTYAVKMVSAKEIDKIRIVASVTKAMNQAIKRVINDPIKAGILGEALPRQSYQGKALVELDYDMYDVKLDGGLSAPEEFIHQETIIKGDSKEKVIGLASIMAKVTRDQYMVRIAKKSCFAPYTFDVHKGYGTKKHRESIAQNGLSTEHRATYCKNVVLL